MSKLIAEGTALFIVMMKCSTGSVQSPSDINICIVISPMNGMISSRAAVTPISAFIVMFFPSVLPFCLVQR